VRNRNVLRQVLREDGMRQLIATLVIVVLFFTGGVTGCSPKEEQSAPRRFEKVTLAVSSWPASAPIYVAYEKGYFKDQGLEITLHVFTSGHLALDAMLTGKADFATAGDTPIARAALDGKPLSVIVTISEVNRAIRMIARKDRGISTPSDLRGKKIGLVRGTAADFFFHTYLAVAYINPRDVQVVNLATDKLVDALLEGEVDAVSTWSPFTLVLRNRLGSNAVILDQPSIYVMTWNIAATRQFAKNSPQRIKNFLQAILRSNRFIEGHPDEAREISAKHIGTDSPLYEKEWPDYSFTAKLDQGLILNLEDQARWMGTEQVGSVRRPPDFMDFIYADALKAVQPGAVTVVGK
jgi:ABC-type nitrate/sulfonate/bicarbonate transport system substrate-binding protein